MEFGISLKAVAERACQTKSPIVVEGADKDRGALSQVRQGNLRSGTTPENFLPFPAKDASRARVTASKNATLCRWL